MSRRLPLMQDNDWPKYLAWINQNGKIVPQLWSINFTTETTDKSIGGILIRKIKLNEDEHKMNLDDLARIHHPNKETQK